VEGESQPGAITSIYPLHFSHGDAMQFDWSLEHVVIGGIAQTIKVGRAAVTLL